MIGIYFSGTGNSKYCLDNFLRVSNSQSNAYAIEEPQCINEIQKHEEIVFAYPVQYSNIPKIVKDFIVAHKELWSGKTVFVIATMGLFSGDGAGILARLLKSYGANISGGLHVLMPDSISDEKVLRRSYAKNKEHIAKALVKVEKAALLYKEGSPTREGLHIGSHIAGLFGQRLYFYHKTKHYRSNLKIDIDYCTGCGTCVNLCPMKNLSLSQHKAVAGSACTMCYRCISQCPNKAITLLGKRVIEQYHIKHYVE